MLIDWFTVIAQIINFLILLWLLKRFLFKPILKAIDEREKKIKTQIQEADLKLELAEEEQKEFNKKNKDFDQEREALLGKAVERARKKRSQLIDEARHEAEELRSQLELAIQEEQDNLGREVKQRTQHEVIAIARKVLTDLASTKLEEHVTQLFIRRLRQMKGDKKDLFLSALQESSGDITIKSAFTLLQKQEEEIEEAMKDIAGEDLRCRFEISAETISGIEVNVHGYKMAWSVADYLSSLEKKLAELLDQESELPSRSKPATNESTV